MFYNIWKQQHKTEGSKHFGNSEVRWVDNLLYSYTKPFDIVVDPFAGGGSTIDICKKRFRRYLVSDRKPDHRSAVAGETAIRVLPRCPLPEAQRKLRFGAGTSESDPDVWSGRALQEVFVELSVCGLASMYPASDWSFCSGPPWISARMRSH